MLRDRRSALSAFRHPTWRPQTSAPWSVPSRIAPIRKRERIRLVRDYRRIAPTGTRRVWPHNTPTVPPVTVFVRVRVSATSATLSARVSSSSMDSFLSSAAASTTSLFRSDLMIPRVRARPTTGTSSVSTSSTITTVMDDAPRSSSVTSAPPRSSTSSSSSSSSSATTARRRALGSGLSGVAASFAAGEDFSQQARASTSSTTSESAHAAARLREITRRVSITNSPGGAGPSLSMQTARSVSPELYAFDTASEAGTLLGVPSSHPPRTSTTDPRHVPMPSDLDSDLDSMAANAYKPHASRSRAVPGPERLKALVDTLNESEEIDERPTTPPRIRVRTLSFPESSPQPVRTSSNQTRVSLSDEEAEGKIGRYSSTLFSLVGNCRSIAH